MNNRIYSLAGIPFEISGNMPLQIEREFEPFLYSGDCEAKPELSIYFLKNGEFSSGTNNSGEEKYIARDTLFSNNKIEWNNSFFNMRMHFGKRIYSELRLKPEAGIKPYIRKGVLPLALLRDPRCQVPEDRITAAFFYLPWRYLTTVLLARHGMAYSHASSVVSASGKAYLFGGEGGVGKTMLALLFTFDQRLRILSDDLSIIGGNGVAYLNPSPLHIYGYNLAQIPGARVRLMNSIPYYSRWHWDLCSLFRRNSLCRRIRFDKFFKSHEIGKCGDIAAAFWLCKSTAPCVRIEEISPERYAEWQAAVTVSELFNILPLLITFGLKYTYQSELLDLFSHLERMRDVFAQGLKQKKTFKVSIPIKGDSVTLVKQLRPFLEMS